MAPEGGERAFWFAEERRERGALRGHKEKDSGGGNAELLSTF
jgi:hypothetical protein